MYGSGLSVSEWLLRASAYRERRPGGKVGQPPSGPPAVEAPGDWRWGKCELGEDLRARAVAGGGACWVATPLHGQLPRGRQATVPGQASLTTLQMGHPDSQPLDVTWSCLIPEGVCCGRVTVTPPRVDLPLKALG